MTTLSPKSLSALALSALILASIQGVSANDHDHEHDHDHAHHDHNHDHDHSHDDDQDSDIYAGYFDDEQVEDRALTDWEGDWQSVYPYLKDGTLDEVFADKAEEGDKTAEEYKAYYDTGYQTDVERIVIDGNNVTFYEDGEEISGDYQYDGYEILTYEAGNRGVRFIYALEDAADDDLPQYIQFSDQHLPHRCASLPSLLGR